MIPAQFHKIVSLRYLWICHEFRGRHHGTGGNTCLLQLHHQLVLVPIDGELGDGVVQLVLMSQACRHVGKARLVDPGEERKVRPGGLVRAGDGQPLVVSGTGVDTLWRERPVPIPGDRRWFACKLGLDVFFAQQADGRLVERQVDILTLAGCLALRQRRDHRGGCGDPGNRIRQCHGGVTQLLVVVAHECRQARHGFHTGAEGDEVRVWARCAEARHGHIDDLRIGFPHGLVSQPQPVHRGRAEILDHHITLGYQGKKQALAGCGLEVDADATLVAVQLVEEPLPVPVLGTGVTARVLTALDNRNVPRPPCGGGFQF